MKRGIFWGTIICLTIAMWAQVQKPYSYAFSKGNGECLFTGKSLDEVWSAANRTLLQDKFRVIAVDKQGGTIVAEKRPPWSYNYRLSLFIEQAGQDVRVSTSAEPVNIREGLEGAGQLVGQNGAHEKLERRFYEKMAALLYK
jgi:hypothetical protein